ncbi:hypothetical protein [Staphylococcus hominis]|uniref:hypothetical protein n=1 Tax=Staphylococcus hominis TaxID=1290 RepID=UPI0022E4BE31|nr:hypothetical protein [Staphylococcus hominis]
MAKPTLDELVAFMKKHGVEKVDSITDEKSAIKHFRAASRVYKEERDSFRKQRDELINDMAEVKRKAEAFDEIVKANDKSDSPEDFGDLVWGILMDYGVIHNEG